MPNLGEYAVSSVMGAIGGGLQRFAWETNEQVGFIATGGMILAGAFGPNLFRGRGMDQLFQAAGYSGAAIAGWVTTEKFMLGAGKSRVGHLPAQVRRSLGTPRALSAGRGISMDAVMERDAVEEGGIIRF